MIFTVWMIYIFSNFKVLFWIILFWNKSLSTFMRIYRLHKHQKCVWWITALTSSCCCPYARKLSYTAVCFVWEHCPHAYPSVSGPLAACKPVYPVHVAFIPSPTHTHTNTHETLSTVTHNILDVKLLTSRGEKHFDLKNMQCSDRLLREISSYRHTQVKDGTLLLHSREK